MGGHKEPPLQIIPVIKYARGYAPALPTPSSHPEITNREELTKEKNTGQDPENEIDLQEGAAETHSQRLERNPAVHDSGGGGTPGKVREESRQETHPAAVTDAVHTDASHPDCG